MKNIKIFTSALIRLYACINSEQRDNLITMVALMALAALCEVFSIGALFPLLSVIINPEMAFNSPYFGPILKSLGIKVPSDLLFSISVLFSFGVVTSAIVRLVVLKLTSEVAYGIGAELSSEIFRKTLLQPYLTHVVRNSSHIIDGLTSKNTALIECIRCCVNIASASLLLFIIGVALILFNPLVTGIVILFLGVIYIFISIFTKKIFTKNGKIISKNNIAIVQEIQESIGSIREIILNKNADFFTDIYKKTVVEVMRARSQNNYVGGAPRHVIEASGMVLMAALAYYFFAFGGREHSIVPILGVVALSSQRVLPILQQLYSSWSDLLAQHASLLQALELLEQKIPLQAKSETFLSFERSIVLKDVEFKYYANDRSILKGINLAIQKGERVAIIGPTGGGKSTLLDLLMAIIYPTAGSLIVDDVTVNADNAALWHARIAHVPQNIFLADKSIAENIAFGKHTDQIDLYRVEHVAKQVQLRDAIALMPNGFNTRVGERGMQLSGGQRQRVAIARALYMNAEVIVLDEVTSALDNQTEFKMMDTIRNIDKNITIIIVTHREKSIKDFDSTYLLKDAILTQIHHNYS